MHDRNVTTAIASVGHSFASAAVDGAFRFIAGTR
jgi:hypothetical protein